MQPSQDAPHIPLALLEHLEGLFRDRLPETAAEPHHAIMFRSGSAFVVRYLRAAYERQNENILNRKDR